MKQSMNNARLYWVCAAALLGAVAAYTYFHNAAEWPQALMWAAIGALFLTLGLARKKT